MIARLVTTLTAGALLVALTAARWVQHPANRRKGYAIALAAGEGPVRADAWQASGGNWTDPSSSCAPCAGSVVAVQSNGGIVLGSVQPRDVGWHFKIVVLRFTADGRLDTTMNGTGFVKTTVRETSDFLRGVAIQTDGRIVAAANSEGVPSAGTTPVFFALVRYAASGQLDPTFGHGGRVVTQPSKYNQTFLSAFLLQPDGRMLVAGSAQSSQWFGLMSRYDYAVARYLPTGRLDPAFGHHGITVHAIGDRSEDVAAAMALQPDGKIVVAGQVHVRFAGDIGLLRLNADGSVDRSFGNGGQVITEWKAGRPSSVIVQSDGKILVVADSAVLRYLPDGALDLHFAYGGIKPIPFGQYIVQQPDGKILLEDVSRLARYLPDWRLDVSFGDHGIVTLPLGGSFRLGAPVLQPDGKILLGGSSMVDGRPRFTIVRCNANGTLDRSFGDPQ